MRRRAEKDPVPNAISAEGVGGRSSRRRPNAPWTRRVLLLFPLGGQWPEDWCGVTGPTSPSLPTVFSLCGLYLDTHSFFFFLKDNGIKMKKLFGCVGLFHSGVRAVCCGCSVAGRILVPRPGLEPTAPAMEALDH